MLEIDVLSSASTKLAIPAQKLYESLSAGEFPPSNSLFSGFSVAIQIHSVCELR